VAVSGCWDGEAWFFTVVWRPGRARHPIAEQASRVVATVPSRDPAPGVIAALSNKAQAEEEQRWRRPLCRWPWSPGPPRGSAARWPRRWPEGYGLALTDLREPAETLQAVRGRGAEALTAVGDVTSQADVAAVAEQVRRHFGGASVLVNNAGISLLVPLSRPRRRSGGGCWR
jgi:NAD(P)-dependent dehydrogenase (short-subunit alcohol dehydrogenase family)